MGAIYDLYAGDAEGLREITGRFLQNLELLKTAAPGWLQQQNWELLHRHTHQAKATAAMYGLPELCRLLDEVSSRTRTVPGNPAALEAPMQLLPATIEQAVIMVQKKLDHVS